MKRGPLYRILDANFNRSREGLRVAEEIARFWLNDRALTAALKKARHSVSAAIKQLPDGYASLVRERDTVGDVGRPSSALEKPRGSARDLFLANAQRAKESLRVLEECSKFVHAPLSARFKQIRFAVYAAEKRALPQLDALRHHGPKGRRRR